MKSKSLLRGEFLLLVMFIGSGLLGLNWASEMDAVKMAYAAGAKGGTGGRIEGKTTQQRTYELFRKLYPGSSSLTDKEVEQKQKEIRKKLGWEDPEDNLTGEIRKKSVEDLHRILRKEHTEVDETPEQSPNSLRLRLPESTSSLLKRLEGKKPEPWPAKIDPINMQFLLAYMGRYNSKLDGEIGPITRKALREFQKNSGIPVSGKMDNGTEEKLRSEYRHLLGQFTRVGFRTFTLTDAIERYRRYLDLGKLTSGAEFKQMSASLEWDLKCSDDVVALYRGDPFTELIRAHEITQDPEKETVAHALVMGVDGVWEDWSVTEVFLIPGNRLTKMRSIQRTRGNKAIDWWDARYTEKIKAKSDEITAFFRTSASPTETGQYEFHIGKESLLISQTEMDNLRTGEGDTPEFDAFLKRNPTLRQFVLCSAPFSTAGDRKNALDIVQGMDSRFGDRVEVLLDDDLDIGWENANNLHMIRGPTDLSVFISKESFNVKTYGVLESIEAEFKEAQVQVVRDTSIVEASNIIIITGHKDEDLKNYLAELGWKGCLQGKMLLMFSCYDKGDTLFNSEAIKAFGIRDIAFFGATINPQAVQEVVVDTCEITKKLQGSEITLRNLLRKAVDQALERNKSGPDKILLPEIEKLRKAVNQISRLRGLYKEYYVVPCA